MKYQLFNFTDGILASPRLFDSEEQAASARERWLMERAGSSYRTGSGTYIDPQQVILEIQPVSGH